MALLDKGRVCRKTRGRKAGQFTVIVGKQKDGLIVQSHEGQKKKMAAAHLEPTHYVVDGKNPAKELENLGLE